MVNWVSIYMLNILMLRVLYRNSKKASYASLVDINCVHSIVLTSLMDTFHLVFLVHFVYRYSYRFIHLHLYSNIILSLTRSFSSYVAVHFALPIQPVCVNTFFTFSDTTNSDMVLGYYETVLVYTRCEGGKKRYRM